MDADDWIGWLAAGTLLVTTVAQIVRQWRTRSSKGVSIWLFGGECAAAILFLWYAVRIHNTVYVVSNVLMLLASLVGLGMLVWHRAHARRDRSQARARRTTPSSMSASGTLE